MKRLLLIEDDPNTLAGLADLLRLGGYWVCAAKDGRAGFELAGALARQAGAAPFDAILCDFKLPDMNGLEVCRRLRQFQPELAFFLLTAYNKAEIIRAAKACGVKKIFYKPLDLDNLFATLAVSVSN
jgi:CheY-like chemotaxis protein